MVIKSQFVLSGCGSMINMTLESPGYPNNYPSKIDCVDKVFIPHGKALKIYFQMFDLELNSSCG